MSKITSVTLIEMSVEDYNKIQEQTYESSLGTSDENFLTSIYGIKMATNNALEKGHILVHEHGQAVPKFMTIYQFRENYGTI